MFKWLKPRKKLLFSVYIDLEKLKVKKEGSATLFCMASIRDETVVNKLNEIVDYIRENHEIN